MASTYTSLHYHVVFSTRQRAPQLDDAWREELHAYIGGVLRSVGGELLCAGSVDDHVHLVLRTKPTAVLSKVIGTVKANSSRWINTAERVDGRFEWQRGYAAFSVGVREVAGLRNLAQQREHHGAVSYRDELIEALEVHGVAFDEAFLVG